VRQKYACPRPSPCVDMWRCALTFVAACRRPVPDKCNGIQDHRLSHQKVVRRTGRSCSTVTCYFLLRDIEFKNESQRRSCRRGFWANDVNDTACVICEACRCVILDVLRQQAGRATWFVYNSASHWRKTMQTNACIIEDGNGDWDHPLQRQ